MNGARMYWSVRGVHVHVAVFVNGARCGELCFRCSEWELLSPGFEAMGFELRAREVSNG